MKSVGEIYGPRFFARRCSLNWRPKIVCTAISNVLKPKSVIDVGCAIGDYVQYWESVLGVKAHGIEGSPYAAPYFVSDKVIVADVRKEIVRIWADLVTCLEVLEHIEIEYIDNFLSNMIPMSDRFLVSAAPPGQGGHYHVNCQPREYWVKKMKDLGFCYDESIVEEVRKEMEPWKHKKEIRAYYNNLLYFERERKNVSNI